MDLHVIWYILVAVLFTGYFFLEGFDFGVGILMPFLGRDDTDRRVIINTIGPVWDGNEVWLITAGGAMFAAFPNWYATLFSGFYLALFLILVALILRIAGLEFRSKLTAPTWRRTADAFIFIGSFLPALLWGVALSNLVRGVPIDANMEFTGNLLTLLTPYAILGGVVSTLVFTLHGALFLTLRTEGEVNDRARRVAQLLWWPAAVLLLGFAVWGQSQARIFAGMGVVPGTLPILAAISYIATLAFMRMKADGWAFAASGATIALGSVVAFEGLFPNVMLSSLNEKWNLTIYNASSSEYSLKAMLIVALFFVPIVLLYQGWTYWVFRQRISRATIEGQGH
ncbi:MAG TPA: cytochrome d ubiquinol oxidase subunit II [Deinococcales bacterium]|nr:cytochrome d ubiquinol oxidase subunit II [Deinococcales bacterium]